MPRLCGLPLSLLSVLLVGCASTGAPTVAWGRLWPELARIEAVETASSSGLFPARRPEAAGLDTLRDAERLWRQKDDEAFARARDEISRDPVLAFWLARMLVRDTLFLRENARADVTAMVGEPSWRRPFDQLVAMGNGAAPCVVLDLLRDDAVDRRIVASDLLREMGVGVLPSWQRVFDVDDARVRRYAVRAIADWEPTPRTVAILEQAATDADFGVRAEAFRGLGRCGPEYSGRLRAALDQEDDPFVQRAIIDGLGYQRDRQSAEQIVAFLERATRDHDMQGQEASKRALMRISGLREAGNPVSWRRWLAGWDGT